MKRNGKRQARRVLRAVEALERRVMLAAFAAVDGDAVLRVSGTAGADVISVTKSGSNVAVTRNGETLNFNAGTIGDISVDAGDGDDSVVVVSDIIRAEIIGGAGNDSLKGGSASDHIYGGPGNDTMNGEAGNDSCNGGDGSDVATWIDRARGFSFSFNGRLTATNGQEGDGSEDAIETVVGTEQADHFTSSPGYDPKYETEGITFDCRGGNDDFFATEMSLANVLFPTTVLAGDGDDKMTVQGGAWAVLYGGAGNDLENASNESFEFFDGGPGIDAIHWDWSGSLDLNDLPNVENATLFGGELTGTLGANELTIQHGTIHGGGGNDTLTGGDSGDATIFGEGGNDVIHGGTGSDGIDGGAGDDTIFGGGGADVLSGDIGRDSILGEAGNDFIDSADGDVDTIDGGDGIDGGLWNSGELNDVVSGMEAPALTSTGTINVTAPFGIVVTVSGDQVFLNMLGLSLPVAMASAKRLHLSGSNLENRTSLPSVMEGDGKLIGGSGADSITGGAGTELSGGGGNDTLVGSGGALLHGEAGDDLLIAAGAVLMLEGDAGNDTLRGSGLADVLEGGDGDDVIYAGAGDDTIYGGAGRDRIYGDDGNDEISAVDGQRDTLYGGSGSNSARFDKSAKTTDLAVDVEYVQPGITPLAWLTRSRTVVVMGKQQKDWIDVTVSGSHVVVTFNAGLVFAGRGPVLTFRRSKVSRIYMDGGTGNDTMRNYTNLPATMLGGAGDDFLGSTNGDDVLNGNSGRDYLSAGGGSDTLVGGTGVDTLVGQVGDDLIISRGDSSTDWVYGQAGKDRASVDGEKDAAYDIEEFI